MVGLEDEGVAMTARGKVIDRDFGFKALSQFQTKNARGVSIDIGWFAGEVATYVLANEFGTATIPARAFVRTTIDSQRPKYERMLIDVLRRAQAQNLDLATAMQPIANEVRNDVIKAIQTWSDPANAESTVAKKGFNAPLVDTGQMQRALNIRTNGGGAA